ncbi:MAG TPA: cytochrome b N-terminal domain-containing protein, partial [Verrucomicrobiae bacterium]|nr:cytochrome b N-terminal domain-containing protein [Verrucomicrobiae bacterium]
PGGARWRYVWGSALTFALAVQFITGLFLWLAYNPSSQTAWESVYYIQHHMTGGAWLRGIHHFTAQAMNVLLVLHLMQVVIDGAYKAPREVNFWFGFVLLLLVLALSLTGYLLPWDQKGFWATKVATNIVAITPFIGPQLQKLIIGGADYGHHTLSRFFALHAGFLPGLIVVLLAGHIYLFRRHGLTVKEPRRGPDTYFWPDQVLKDAVACLAVLATVLFLIIAGKGAELGGPADPTEPYSAARPEWYFLFLFQFLKYFPGGTEVWGAIVVPTLILVVMCLMPFFGKWRLGHLFNIGFLVAMFIGVALLTGLAIKDDRGNASFRAAKKAADHEAERIKVLAAAQGIPTSGAANLLGEDPFVQGPKLFARNCSSCHRYGGDNALGLTPKDPQSAADLKGFASRDWIERLLDPAHITSTNYFGGTKFASGKMVKFVKKDLAEYTPQQKEQVRKALSAEAKLKSQAAAEPRDASDIAAGRALIKSKCTECHAFGAADEDATGPDLTGYGSREWLIGFISNPAHPKFYGKRNDRMPRFAEEKILDTKSIALIADWLREDWYEPSTTASIAR